MKASTFAILIGVYLALLGPVLLIAPATIPETMGAAMQDPFQMAVVFILFAMLSTLTLAHKPAGNGLPEKLVRLLAWLTLIKVVVLFWVPAARELSITYLHKVPLSLLRIEGLAATAIGSWLIYWGTQAMRHASENTTN
ncbi:MAG: hypothetical protein OSB47_15160 [Pirellulaceae bacterium]|nr:hypothetical protein [Pirellulaceae bacterium]